MVISRLARYLLIQLRDADTRKIKESLDEQARTQPLAKYSREHPLLVLAFLGVILAALGHYFLNESQFRFQEFTKDFYNNYYAEIIGLALTVYLIDKISKGRDDRQRLSIQIQRNNVDSVSSALREMAQNGWLQNIDLSSRKLSSINLGDFDLGNTDFTDTDLRLANLRGSDMSRVKLNGTKLKFAEYDHDTKWPSGFDFRECEAIGPHSDLKQKDLSERDLSDTVLTDADLSGADLSRSNLRNADFRGAKLHGSKLTGAVYDSATKWPENFQYQESGAIEVSNEQTSDNTEHLKTTNSAVEDIEINGIENTELSLQGMDLSGATFAECVFETANFAGANLEEATFMDCTIETANFAGANLEGATFMDCTIETANFADANLDGATFTNCTIETANFDSANLDAIFAITIAAATAELSKQVEAQQIVNELKAEAVRGEQANDRRMAQLIDRFVELVPTGASAVISAFRTPVLADVAGPMTKFVVDRMVDPAEP